MCAQATQSSDSLIDEVLRAHQTASQVGRAYVSAEAYDWVRPSVGGFGCSQYGASKPCAPVVAFDLAPYVPGVLEITVTAGVFDVYSPPLVDGMNIAAPFLIAFLLIFSATFDYARYRLYSR
jgi:hypothetical protein